MKKTILAVAIAAVSFGAVADVQTPDLDAPIRDVITEAHDHLDGTIILENVSVDTQGGYYVAEVTVDDVTYTVDKSSGDVYNSEGKKLGSIDVDSRAKTIGGKTFVAVENANGQRAIILDDGRVLANDTTPEWGADKPRPELPKDSDNVLPDRPEASEQIRDLVSNGKDIVGGEIDRIDGAIYDSSARMDSLEQDLYKQGQKMLELDDRMDQVMASSHAITNARPVLANAGEYAVGVGVGFAGSTEALALGGAYQVNDSWSVSGTMNYATSTSHASSDFSAGVGAHYRFGN